MQQQQEMMEQQQKQKQASRKTAAPKGKGTPKPKNLNRKLVSSGAPGGASASRSSANADGANGTTADDAKTMNPNAGRLRTSAGVGVDKLAAKMTLVHPASSMPMNAASAAQLQAPKVLTMESEIDGQNPKPIFDQILAFDHQTWNEIDQIATTGGVSWSENTPN